MTMLRYIRLGSIALVAALQMVGCASRPIAVVPLNSQGNGIAGAPSEPLYSIANGIKATNTTSITPKAWKRAQEFCKNLGKQPQDVQVGQQWPPVRDFVFACVPIPDRNRR